MGIHSRAIRASLQQWQPRRPRRPVLYTDPEIMYDANIFVLILFRLSSQSLPVSLLSSVASTALVCVTKTKRNRLLPNEECLFLFLEMKPSLRWTQFNALNISPQTGSVWMGSTKSDFSTTTEPDNKLTWRKHITTPGSVCGNVLHVKHAILIEQWTQFVIWAI